MSHFDGKSAVDFTCGICKLPSHYEMRSTQNICVPCHRFQRIQGIASTFSRYSLPALLVGITILIFDTFSPYKFMIPFLAVIFLIPVAISTSFVQMQIYRGIEPKYRMTHMIKFYSMLNYNEGIYYKAALSTLERDMHFTQQHKQILLHYLVDYIMLDNKPKPSDYLETWYKALDFEKEEFVDLLFEYTNIMEAFHLAKGVGVLPDLWDIIKDKHEIRDKVLDEISESCKNIEEATQNERLYFLEDLFLIEEDLIKIIEKEQKWFVIDDVLVEFEPETPPSNPLQSFMAQANENARMMEQKNQVKQQNPESNQIE